MGAKNHGVILPDADKIDTINNLVAAAFGGQGQRCMALSYDLFVGDSYKWIDEIAEKVRKLKPGNGFDKDSDYGPVISKEALERITKLIDSAEKEGCRILVDGRNFKHPKYPNGNYIGPTMIVDVEPHHTV